MRDGRSTVLGIVTIVAALQVLPFSDIMAKYLSGSLPVIQVIWGRFFFHVVVTGLFVGLVLGTKHLWPQVSWILFLRSAALFCAVGLFYVTIHHLPLTTSLTLWFVEPFILTLMAALIARERIAPAQWVGVVLGFVGIVIAIRPTVVAWHWAYLVGLLAGFFYAAFLFLTRFIDSRVPAVASVYHTGLVGGVAATIAVVPNWSPPTGLEWGLLVATGVVAALAHLLIIKSFEMASAGTIAPFTYSEILMGAVLGYVVFNDAPDVWLVLGLAIVVGSGILVAKSQHVTAEP